MKILAIRMRTVLMMTRSVVTANTVLFAMNAITVTMELTEPAVRVEMDTPLKRAVIAQVSTQ